MEKLNYKDVNHATRLFWATFALLLLFSFLTVYFFLESSRVQHSYIIKDINDYKALLNKQQLIKQQTDSLYSQLSLLNTGKVDNDPLLEKYIADNKNKLCQIIGNDSVKEFQQYAYLMNNLDNMLRQKDTIIGITSKEKLALNDLMACMNKIRKVKSDLSFDPTRNFSAAK
jgi:hypothetical protein